MAKAIENKSHQNYDIDNMRAYLNDIVQLPFLSEKEEKSLSWKMKLIPSSLNLLLIQKNPNVKAINSQIDSWFKCRQKLAEAHLPFVVSIAKSYQNKGMELLDLISEGNDSLLIALEKFDPSKGYRITTYAKSLIKQDLVKAIDNKATLIKVNHDQRKKIRKEDKILDKQTQELGRELTPDEIASITNNSITEIKNRKVYLTPPISLNKLQGEEDDLDPTEKIPDPYLDPHHSILEKKERIKILEQALLSIDPLFQQIIIKRYGLEDDEPQTQATISASLDLSRQRVTQLEKQALQKLKQLISNLI